MDTQALVIEKGKPRLERFALRSLEQGEMLIRAEYTCISPGTELRMMRLSGDGSNPEPYIPGYAFVGIIEEAADDSFTQGQRVYCSGSNFTGPFSSCWGAHAQFAIVGAGQCIAVPETVDPVVASLAAMGAIAHHGFTKSKPLAGEKVVHVGLGVLGQISARLHAMTGAEVIACDLSAARVDMSNKSGVKAVLPTDGLAAAVAAHMEGGPSLVVDSTGAVPVLKEAIQLVPEIPWDDTPEPNNRYMIQGSYAGEFSIPYQDAFVRQLSFIIPRNLQRSDTEAFLNYLASGDLRADDLIGRLVKPADATQAYDALRDPVNTPGTIAFDWRD